jgi:hypothetical protein
VVRLLQAQLVRSTTVEPDRRAHADDRHEDDDDDPATGDFVRWESSSEGSNCRCTSLAAKALTTAANLIQTLIITILILEISAVIFLHGLRSLWF